MNKSVLRNYSDHWWRKTWSTGECLY